jgi:hypothetical protein
MAGYFTSRPNGRLGYKDALLLDTCGRPREAEPLYASALRTFAAALAPGHPKIRACAENYAGLLRDQGRGAAARALESKHGLG